MTPRWLRPSPAAATATIDFGPAALGWLAAYVVGSLLPLLTISAAVALDPSIDPKKPPIPVLVLGLVGMWGVFAAVLVALSRRFGTGSFMRDYAVGLKPVDLVMIPLGIGLQYALVIVYWPLRQLWPVTFSNEALSKTAKNLTDGVHGVNALLLMLAVVVGAPVVEELVYRGLLQRSLSKSVQPVVAWVAVSAWFALIHFHPVEFPGLFVAGLLFGAGYLFTGRLGPGMVAHCAFNAVGLLTAFR